MCDSVLGNKFNTIPQAGKKIILTPSLFMRLLEWSKEDAKDDIALHQVFEKIMAFSDGTNPVGIECYDALIKDATGSSLPDDKAEYDCQTAEGEPQVNGELCDRLENIVASYHEGGIGGNQCYDCIQDAFADNVQCPEQQICCDDIECVAPSCCQNIVPGCDGMTIAINCEDGSCCDGSETAYVEEIPAEYDAQVADIIKLGQF